MYSVLSFCTFISKIIMSDTDIYTKFYFLFLFIYSHVHTLFESFLPPTPYPFPLPHTPPPLLPGRICSALISNFVKEKT
jgi:hypothetical protein